MIYISVCAIIITHTIIFFYLVIITWSYIIMWITIVPALLWAFNHFCVTIRKEVMMWWTKGEQYSTCLLKPLRGIFQLRVSCHIWPNTLEYTVHYSKQNETDLCLKGEGWWSYNDLFAYSDIYIYIYILDAYMQPRSLKG